MHRLIVLDAGRIVEEGTHDELLRLGGHYAKLWQHQSGGFLAPDLVATETAVELPDEPPIDELRAETKPEPSVDDAPLVAKA
jgi:ATP-binding cassette subfamily B multidrug efflux pump